MGGHRLHIGFVKEKIREHRVVRTKLSQEHCSAKSCEETTCQNAKGRVVADAEEDAEGHA